MKDSLKQIKEVLGQLLTGLPRFLRFRRITSENKQDVIN